MTVNQYATIQDNYFGIATKNPVAFTGELDLALEVLTTLRADFDVVAPITTGKTLTFATEGVSNPKIIVIQTDTPAYVTLNGGTDNIPCDPLCIITNQAPTAGSLISIKITPVSLTVAVNCKIRIRT